VTREWWIGKDLEGSGSGLIVRYYVGIFLEGLSKTTKNFSQDSRSRGRDLNPGTPENEAGVLNTRPQRSVEDYDILESVYYDFSKICWRSCISNVSVFIVFIMYSRDPKPQAQSGVYLSYKCFSWFFLQFRQVLIKHGSFLPQFFQFKATLILPFAAPNGMRR
jgi:hypothetical protein